MFDLPFKRYRHPGEKMKDKSSSNRSEQEKIMDQFSLKNKVAIVTGAGQGIGRAIALTFAKAGAELAIVDIDSASTNATAQEIHNFGGKALALSVDVCNTRQVDGMVRETIEQFKRIDISVHNAGGGYPTKATLEMSEKEWDKSIALNLKSAFLCCKAVGKVMAKQGKGSTLSICPLWQVLDPTH
jgi:NAD(P)-dependent dehydrogenase (short-subunit alcohol dehydrogenase family)